MNPPILLIDAFGLLYRSHYGLPAMHTSTGEATSAIYGVSVVLLKLLREEQPLGAVFAFDLPQPTFRHRAFADYKATRVKPEQSLASQFERLEQLVTALGVPSFRSPGYEADDVLATLARELSAEGHEPLVVTGDNDCLQLARGPTRVQIHSRNTPKPITYDEDAVEARFGVTSEQMPDRSALVGDVSDNLPGVDGIGDKTAVALVRRFGSIAGILSHLDDITPKRAQTAIREAAERLPLYLELARLRSDVPLGPDQRWAEFTPEAGERLKAFFEQMEFRSLIPRVDSAFRRP